jgi:hypothetical protein
MLRDRLALLAALALACTSGERADRSPAGPGIVFSPEGNRLNAYAAEPPFAKQTVIRNRSADPAGWDINGQLCFAPDGSGVFVVGEDTGQPDPPPAWGIFQLSGRRVGELSARRIGRLVPTYQPSDRNPDNFGCAFLPDGRVLSTVIGSLSDGPEDGQLILWFPPFDPEGPTAACKLDVEIGMAGQIQVDAAGRIYVAGARGHPGIWRYSGALPSSPDAAGGCGRRDAAGSPLVDAGRLSKEHFIDGGTEELAGAMGLAVAPDGSFFVSRSVAGVIAQFDAQGRFVRRVVEPPAGAVLGPAPFPAGSPSGLAFGADGSLYYADLGLVAAPALRPKLGQGSVRRVRLSRDGAEAPELVGGGLDYPDVVSFFAP